MRNLFRLAGSRLLPALLTALGVVLITGGLLSYADPNTIGGTGSPSAALPTDVAIVDPSDGATASPDPADPPAARARTPPPRAARAARRRVRRWTRMARRRHRSSPTRRQPPPSSRPPTRPRTPRGTPDG